MQPSPHSCFRKHLILSLATVFSASGMVWGFTPESRLTITLNAFKLMPPSLRIQLEKHKKECLRGALDPLNIEGEEAHHPGENGKLLAERISAQVDKIVGMIGRHETFKKVIYEMGVLSHYTADLNFPVSINGEGKEHYLNFARFCYRKEKKIRIVFYGFEDSFLARKDIPSFSSEAIRRSSSNIPFLKEAFLRAANGSETEFDDRSTLFGVAALSYSHAVTDIAKIWLYAWNEAKGDLTETPHLRTLQARGKM
ncbi:MAG: hypothetical protein AB1756_04295 [Acidobacteriota bacterium]